MLNDLLTTLPLGIVAIMGCLVLLLDAFSTGKDAVDRRYLGRLSAAGIVAALGVVHMLWGRETQGLHTATFTSMMVMGRFELAAVALILLIGLCVVLMAVDYAPEHGISTGELYGLIHFALFGMMVLATATHMVSLFLGLEIMSISVYVLAAIKRSSPFSAEAGLKYFVLGAFGTGFLLYGIAFAYGETAQLGYAGIAQHLKAGQASGYLVLSLYLLVTAFGFKLALVPFHMWTPDVYEGAPTPVTALMATGVKTAGVLAAARLFVTVFPPSALSGLGPDFFKLLGVLAVVTMTAGNLMALPQRNIKRMLAYSSIAHAGYLLIGIMAAHVAADASADWGRSMGPVLFYLFVYSLANLAAFAVLSMLSGGGSEDMSLDQASGLARSNPAAALVLAMAMLSLAGVPPMAGFFGKFTLFREALRVDGDRFLWLVVVAVLNSVVSVYYYLRVIVHAYMRDAVKNVKIVHGLSLALALLIAAGLTIQAGVFPSRYLKATEQAAKEMSVVPAAAAVPVVAAKP